MSEGEYLLRAVIAAPDDDLPRLVYAGWLDEHGEPDRAEFIRIQCELARGGDSPVAAGTAERTKQLREELGWLWLPRHGPRVAEFLYRRGFTEYVSVSAGGFLSRGRRLFESAPITAIHLTDLGDRMDRVARSPLLSRLRSLRLSDDGASWWGLTNHVERFWGTLRQRCARFVRKTLSFSKCPDNHVGALWYFVRLYNASLP